MRSACKYWTAMAVCHDPNPRSAENGEPMKKFLRIVVSLALAIVLCVPAVLPVYAASPSLSVTAPTTVKPGDTFTVRVFVNNNPGIASWRITLSFDTSKLTLVSAEAGAKMAYRGITLNTDQGGNMSNYNQVIGYYATAANFTTTGEYLTATFKVSSSVSEGSVGFVASMDDDYCVNQSYQNVSFSSGTATTKIEKTPDNPGNTDTTEKVIELKENAKNIKYIKGYSDGTFRPNQAATRYEVVEALAKVFDINVATKASGLTDVDSKYEAQVNLFATAKIIDGFPDKTFRGEESITRAQFCKIIAVMMDLNVKNPKNGGFKDVSGWATVYIDACAEAGLVIGKDEAKNLFDPSANITRAELATLVNRITGAGNSGTSCKYSDVKPGSWYFGWVAAAAE